MNYLIVIGQALEIGSPAICFLIDTWEGHLTPPEVASLADRASRGRDPAMVQSAADLALSCLPCAHALNPNEIQRAIMQCKEQNNGMLERACLAVESAAKGGGVYPEVLFDVARRWYELYKETLTGSGQGQSGGERIGQSTDFTTSSVNVGGQMSGDGLTPGSLPMADSLAGSAAPTSSTSPDINVGSSILSEPLVFGQNPIPEGLVAQPSLAIVGQVPVTSVGGVAVTVAHTLPYSLPPPLTNTVGMSFSPAISYCHNYLPNITPHYSQPHLPLQPSLPHHPLHPYIPGPFSYNQTTFPIPSQAYYPLPAVTVASQIRTPPPPPPPPLYANPLSTLPNGQPRPGLVPPAQNGLHILPSPQQVNPHPQPPLSQVRSILILLLNLVLCVLNFKKAIFFIG